MLITKIFAKIGIGSLSTIANFMPHGACYLWKPSLVSLHIASDGFIAIAYFAIPAALIYFVRKRDNLPYPWIFLLFGAFIVSCGTTHLLEIWTLWHPNYWLSGTVKAFTAAISVYTALRLVPLIPKLLALKSPAELEGINRNLADEMAQREKIEAALLESEARYRSIVEDQTELVARYRPDGTLTFANQAYCRYFEQEKEKIVGSKYRFPIFPEDREKIQRCCDALSQENPVEIVEHRVVLNEEVRWMQWSHRAIFDAEGNIIKFQTVGRDISARKQVEEALRESEERLQLALEGSGDGLWDWNIATGKVYLSQRWLEMLGYAPDELPGDISTWKKLIHPEDKPWVMDALNAHLENNSCPYCFECLCPYSFDYRMKTKSGEWKWIGHYGKVVARAEDGTPIRMAGTHKDISDRVLAEQTLQERESILSSFYDSAPVMMGVVELADNDILHLSDNAATASFFGTTPEAMKQKFASEMGVPKDTLDWWLSCYRKSQATGGPVYFECLHETPQGVKYLAVTVSPILDTARQNSRFSYIVEDVTDRKKAEEKIAESLREKEILLKEIHHRVKNNLQVICSLLNLQMRAIQNETVLAQFQDSQNRVRTMALIHEKLYQSQDFSKIPFSEYIRDLSENLFRSYSVKASKVRLKFNLDGNFLLDIDTAIPCGLIVNELISNALKYAFETGQQGEIDIQTYPDEAQNLVLMISDNGCGIPEEINPSKAKTLGLKLVKNLTNQLRGKVEINRYNGTQFKLILTRIKLPTETGEQ